eukprot:scaffold7697_cov76-Cyclotella_meneghiniana.AAC.1
MADYTSENDAAMANRLDTERAVTDAEGAAASTADSDTDSEVGGIVMEECDNISENSSSIPSTLRIQAAWLDPFPTPCSSFSTHVSGSTLSACSSPLHQRNSDNVNVFNPEFFSSPQRSRSRVGSLDAMYQTPVRNNNSSGTMTWNDPFPTPDVSVHSSAYNTNNNDTIISSPEEESTPGKNDNSDEMWGNFDLPLLPIIDSPANKTPSYDYHKRRRSVANIAPHNSYPSLLQSCKPPPIRRISSDTGRFGRVPSMEDFLKNFSQVGPDGNDFCSNENDVVKTVNNNNCDDASKRITRMYSLRRSSNLSQDDLTIGLKQRNPQDDQELFKQQSKDDLELLTNNNNDANNNNNTYPKMRLTPLLTPVRQLGRRVSSTYQVSSQRIKRKLKERRERRRQRREQRAREPPASWWIIIPADHPYKIIWDVLTMVWALLGAYRTHLRIRDRVFDQSPLILITEVWFTLDILLNFVTEHKTTKGQVIRDGKTVWARYLTTWFVIDLLSLIPWERIYVRPVVEKIKRRNFFQKTFFRSKAVVRVSRVLRGRHIKLMGRVSKQTGTPFRRFVRLLIKYVPRYMVFVRHMKGALFVRGLRFVHWLHNMYKKIWVSAQNAGRKARDSLSSKNRRQHPIFDLVEEEDEDDNDDSDTDSDHTDDDDDEQDSQSNLSEMTSMDMSERAEDRDDLFRRSKSENMALRRRSFSEM